MEQQSKSQMLTACEQALTSFANCSTQWSEKSENRVWVKNSNTVYITRTCLQANMLNIILVHQSMLMDQLHTYHIQKSINNKFV